MVPTRKMDGAVALSPGEASRLRGHQGAASDATASPASVPGHGVGEADGGPHRLLVVVHPGTCCGSTDRGYGKYDGDALRDGLIAELAHWQAGVLVIDGLLSDELEPGAGRSSWRLWGEAIKGALAAAKVRGDVAERVWGCDADMVEHQRKAIRDFVSRSGVKPGAWEIALTGAWYDPDGKEGCVNSVGDELEAMGFQPDVLDSAIQVASEDLDEDMDMGVAGEDAAP